MAAASSTARDCASQTSRERATVSIVRPARVAGSVGQGCSFNGRRDDGGGLHGQEPGRAIAQKGSDRFGRKRPLKRFLRDFIATKIHKKHKTSGKARVVEDV